MSWQVSVHLHCNNISWWAPLTFNPPPALTVSVHRFLVLASGSSFWLSKISPGLFGFPFLSQPCLILSFLNLYPFFCFPCWTPTCSLGNEAQCCNETIWDLCRATSVCCLSVSAWRKNFAYFTFTCLVKTGKGETRSLLSLCHIFFCKVFESEIMQTPC